MGVSPRLSVPNWATLQELHYKNKKQCLIWIHFAIIAASICSYLFAYFSWLVLEFIPTIKQRQNLRRFTEIILACSLLKTVLKIICLHGFWKVHDKYLLITIIPDNSNKYWQTTLSRKYEWKASLQVPCTPHARFNNLWKNTAIAV